MSSPKEILENKLNTLETETNRAKDINNVRYPRARAHTLGPSGSYHPAKKNLWTEWLLYFNAAKKKETLDKKELKELLTEYKNIFEKFRVSKCPPISQQIEGSTCLIVSNTLSKLSDEYDLNYDRVPSLMQLAARQVPDKHLKQLRSTYQLDPKVGGKKRRTKKRKKSKKVRKKKKKTKKGGGQKNPKKTTKKKKKKNKERWVPNNSKFSCSFSEKDE